MTKATRDEIIEEFWRVLEKHEGAAEHIGFVIVVADKEAVSTAMNFSDREYAAKLLRLAADNALETVMQ